MSKAIILPGMGVVTSLGSAWSPVRSALAANHTLQELAGLGHHESETIEVVEHFEELIALECRDGVGKLATFT